MDPAHVFRQGLGSVVPRQNHHQALNLPRRLPPPNPIRDDLSDDHDGSGGRIAHTLTACCRCRQRKTRCDPTLPRCLPCERSGSTCEYLDTTKGRKINRYYVIKLQERVKTLEAELSNYVDDESELPNSTEDMIRPGGMIKLGSGDETPRYLGPSSGIAMTRLLMEEAKRYTETNRISDLIPELRARRQARMQSIVMTVPSRKKSYPMTSEHPNESLPNRATVDKLVDVFTQKCEYEKPYLNNLHMLMSKAQVFWPTVHDKELQKDLEAVYNGDTDTHKLFVVRMVLAISLQKLDTQYAGLADGYYLAAMQHFEHVIRAKDLKTLQCLALVAQYSMLTPTRVPVYYVMGLAVKICQQEGLSDEKTIATGYNLDPLTIDMRRRLVWIVASMEFGLAHTLGRPNSFATGDETIDVGFFSNVDDELITENGIKDGPPSPRKLVAIHMCKMRILQAEIRRTLYERKRQEPKNDGHPWFQQMEAKLTAWVNETPSDPAWAKGWFTSRYHQMRIFMYRPSPQISRPTPQAAEICFIGSEHIIDLSWKQLDSNSVDITWMFLLVLNMSLNTLLWTISYPEVRKAHARDDVEELVNKCLDALDRCAERWPGTSSSSQLYGIFSKACLQSYESTGPTGYQPSMTLTTPPAVGDTTMSPDANFADGMAHQQNPFNPPQFGNVFNSPPESMNAYALDPNFPPPQPSFRSNSIFQNPASIDMHGRRFSYFPPDFNQLDDAPAPDDPTPKADPDQHLSPEGVANHLPTPPDSIGNMSTAGSTVANLSPPNMAIPPQGASPMNMPLNMAPTVKRNPENMANAQRIPPYGTPQMSHPTPQPHQATPQPAPQQRPLPQGAPTSAGDWFSPPAPFISAYNMGTMGSNFYNDPLAGANNFGDVGYAGLGLQNLGVGGGQGGGGGGGGAMQFPPHPGRQGSLTQSQQLELMNMLETDGLGDIDAFLSTGNVPEPSWY